MSASSRSPCPVHADEAAWIRDRVAGYRFFEEPTDAGWRYGANRDYMERLRAYWLDTFDWPAAVARLNRHPHFRVEVGDGLRLHVIHRLSSRPDARPLLIAHGWPGSIVEFDAIVDRLAEPEVEDGPAFHVVAPSLMGYAWSDKPPAPIGPRAMAGLYDRLMGVLGYDRYLYQGGDWGCVIGGWIGLDSARVEAIHLSGYGLRSADMHPDTPDEVAWLMKAQKVRDRETAYLQLQGTKPQSLGFAMMDSPMGVAAWFAEKFVGWADARRAARSGVHRSAVLVRHDADQHHDLSDDAQLQHRDVDLHRACSTRAASTIPDGRRIEVPTAVAAFPHDLLAFPPRAMVERGYNVVRYTAMPRGGHFASLEEPELFLADLRAFAASL